MIVYECFIGIDLSIVYEYPCILVHYDTNYDCTTESSHEKGVGDLE